jgi:non-specific protein-tyrosine kinase
MAELCPLLCIVRDANNVFLGVLGKGSELSMEFVAYLPTLRRWSWLILLGVVVAGSVGFVVARIQPARYQASVTIQVGSYSQVIDPSQGMITTSSQLTQTYAALVKTSPIVEAVIKKNQLKMSDSDLVKLFTVNVIPQTALMTITVTYSDPVQVSDIANSLAAQLIDYSPTDIAKQQKDQITLIQNEIATTSQQLIDSRNALIVVESSLATPNAPDHADMFARRVEILNQINAEESNLASLSSTLIALQNQGSVNTVQVVDPASIPNAPINTSALVSAMLGAIVGAILAIGVALTIDYFSNTIRTPGEVTPLLNLPLLGSVAPHGRKGSYKNKLVTWTEQRSSIAEGYRAIRVNLLFREQDEQAAAVSRCYVITSPGPGEGKSFTATNLAITFAITGMRVLLVDLDLRRPVLHQLFNVSNTPGVSAIWGANEVERQKTLFQSAAFQNGQFEQWMDAVRHDIRDQLDVLVQKTEVPRLHLLPAGANVSSPAELLNTIQLKALIQHVTRSDLYDVVLFDTPPALVVTDCSIVATVARARVVMVVESGRTSRPSALRTVEQLQALSIPFAGVIMNRLRAQDRDADYGYTYYYGYSRYGDQKPEAVKSSQ